MSARREIKDAKKPLTFKISPKHVVVAKCGDPNNCVVAQAINDALGDYFDGVEVGSSVTKVFSPGKVVRYATPNKLKRAIPHFDITKQWDLPPGEYSLLPPPASMRIGARPNRWKKKSVKKTTAGRDMFKGRALPTRRVRKDAMMTCEV